jgi:predicted enzyme related to lactoylglutathione lyase
MRIDLVTLMVHDYDEGIAFFTQVLGFDLTADEPALSESGEPKRWVVVRPPGGGTGLLLAKAEGEQQSSAVGRQTMDRVAFFLRVDDVDATIDRLTAAGVRIIRPPRTEPYGRVAVFADLAGNHWDLLGDG